jgi:hypothetical protein
MHSSKKSNHKFCHCQIFQSGEVMSVPNFISSYENRPKKITLRSNNQANLKLHQTSLFTKNSMAGKIGTRGKQQMKLHDGKKLQTKSI